jgi:hypothetical protein
MDNYDDTLSYSSVESSGKKQPEKEFKAKNTTNYFPNIYNKSEKKRYIFGEGAVPLHEIILFIYDFIEEYINDGNEDKTFYLSAITQSASDQIFYHLLKLDGKSSKLERIEKLSENIEKFYNDIEEKAFNIFLNKKNKFYRLDADLKTLKNSYTIYLKEKNRIKELMNKNSIKVSSVD